MATVYTPGVPLKAGAVVAVVGAAVVIAVISGALSHLASRWVYLVLVAPVASVIRRVRMAAPLLASVIAALAVIAALGLHLALDYAHDRSTRVSEIDEMRELKMDIGYEIDEIEASYAEAMAQLSVRSYLSRRFGFAEAGSPPASGFGASLGPTGSITVAGLELLLAAFIAVSFVRQQAREPACATCGAWRVHHKLGEAAYGVSRRIVDALVAERLDEATDLLARPDTREHVEITLLACPDGHDGERGVIRVVDHRRDKHRRPSLRHVADLDVAEAELVALRTHLVENAA